MARWPEVKRECGIPSSVYKFFKRFKCHRSKYGETLGNKNLETAEGQQSEKKKRTLD